MQARLILTDSYFNIFPLLTKNLCGKANDLTHKNFVFCEEKLTLMAERAIANAFTGTFNTEVYSFGNFLRAKKTVKGLLSKEGSAMAVKKILSELPLKCFNRAKINLAPTLFELISQLKSAKVSSDDLLCAAAETDGVLSNKLSDIADVFSAYESYLTSNGLSDQSSALYYLPEIIDGDQEIAKADVFIVGFSGFTAQIKSAVNSLIRKSRSVTAILVGGKNSFAFVNETSEAFKKLCEKQRVPCETETAVSDYCHGGTIIRDGDRKSVV